MTTPWAGGTAVIDSAERWLPTFGIEVNFDGAGTLTTSLTGFRKVPADFAGAGSLTARLSDYQRITADFSGAGTLTGKIVGTITSAFSGAGTLQATLRQIAAGFSGEGSLDSGFFNYRRISAAFGSEGVLLADLLYTPVPPPLDRAPLGKLIGYSVFNSAVPLNPAEGSGSAPSVSPSYTRGVDPEYVLGQDLEITNPAIGSYTGEVVRLEVTGGSDAVSLSVDTLLTLTNKDLHLAPLIDSEQRWTAARAIDYWTQQAGVFYDAVPGDCAYYASGFGHTIGFAAENPHRFYDKIYGAAAPVLLNGRSVRSFGADTLSVAAMYENTAARVPVMLQLGKKLILSAGIALRGFDRTASVLWNLESPTNTVHVAGITVTSDGAVTATLGSAVLATATLPAEDGEYRFTLSIERVSGTAVAAKLTVHSDDLNGSGTLLHDGTATGTAYALPGVLQLRAVDHRSDGGFGDQMLRWGTYLSVADGHPRGLPAVQKVLAQTTRDYPFVSGFQGNVWKMLNEFCSIARLDIQFKDGRVHVGPRQSNVVTGTKFSRLIKTAERREKFKQVAVTDNQSKAVSNDQGVLWRADSVYQLNTREVFETTVQTAHSIISVANPVPVGGITPFPYTAGGGQYVVTGADGYIIAPQWWLDHGGKVEVSLTEKQGEISLKITAPDVDSVRAPYRISEGAADRPALYISGSGVINDPKEVHINTGATRARQGFDSVFTSPFVSGAREVFDVAARMAHEYSSAVADVQYELPADFGAATVFGQYPAGALFTDGERNFRIMEASQTSMQVSGRAVPHTTLGEYKKTYPAGATLADEKARHRGQSIRQFNIKPLRSI
jgi:hypothetical protein